MTNSERLVRRLTGAGEGSSARIAVVSAARAVALHRADGRPGRSPPLLTALRIARPGQEHDNQVYDRSLLPNLPKIVRHRASRRRS